MYKFVKRLLDFVVSFIFLAILSPLLLILMILQVIVSGFPIFYRPLRTGYKNKVFKINKFRTMIKNADKIGGGTTALNDGRITKLGKILRKTKFDEIPQLLNVLVGNMSFVGPRPELKKYTDQYEGEYKRILDVKPGITDFSSIEFASLDEVVGSENADESYERKVLNKKNELRLKYVKEISFKTDFIIFFKTVGVVLKKILKAGAK